MLLQIGASAITNWGSLLHVRATVITKCGSYYKLEQNLLQFGEIIANWDITT